MGGCAAQPRIVEFMVSGFRPATSAEESVRESWT